MKAGDRAILKSFLGRTESPNETRDDEDYWKLIGSAGQILSEEVKQNPNFPKLGTQVLVRFEKDPVEMGLACHNDIPNSLWIFVSDLKREM